MRFLEIPGVSGTKNFFMCTKFLMKTSILTVLNKKHIRLFFLVHVHCYQNASFLWFSENLFSYRTSNNNQSQRSVKRLLVSPHALLTAEKSQLQGSLRSRGFPALFPSHRRRAPSLAGKPRENLPIYVHDNS